MAGAVQQQVRQQERVVGPARPLLDAPRMADRPAGLRFVGHRRRAGRPEQHSPRQRGRVAAEHPGQQSGVATCTPPVTLSGEGTNQSVPGNVNDVAGNSAFTEVTGINIDTKGIAANGKLRIGDRARAISGRAIVDDTAAYYERHTRWQWAAGVGEDAGGRPVAWNLVVGVNDPDRNSERTVWIDGQPYEASPQPFAADLRRVGELHFTPEAERTQRQMWTWDGLSLALCNAWRPFVARDVPCAEGLVELELGASNGTARLVVADDGAGIPASDLERIFERFYQADPSRYRGGAGLGLSIARWIAAEHGGTITAANRPAGGARFEILLPAAS